MGSGFGEDTCKLTNDWVAHPSQNMSRMNYSAVLNCAYLERRDHNCVSILQLNLQ